MATPVDPTSRTASSTPSTRSTTPSTVSGATSASPALTGAHSAPVEPVAVLSPFGWFLILVAGFGLLASTWMLYPTDYDGMWAGYRDSVIGVVVLVCAMWLNTSLPKAPALAVVALGGILAVLFAVFLDNPTRVFVAELMFGVLMLVGAALYGSGRPHRR